MRTIRLYFITAFSLILLHSCGILDDPNEDCPDSPRSGVNLKYDYLLNMDYTNLFGEQVVDLKTFIFNDQGILCDTLNPPVANNALTNDWVRQIKLIPGTYSFLTWAGDSGFGRSFKFTHDNRPTDDKAEGVVIGQTKLEDVRAFLRYNIQPANENMATPQTGKFNELLYGIQKDIIVKPKEYTTVNTSLIKDSKTVRVKIGNLSLLSSAPSIKSDFDIVLTGRNGHYKYDNQTNEDNHLIQYTPHTLLVENDTLQSDMKTLRLRKHDESNPYSAPMSLSVIYKPNNTVVCKDLDIVKLILESRIPSRDSEGHIRTDAEGKTIWVHPTLEYFDRQDLFIITFGIQKTDGDLDFTIYVNGWEIVNIVPET